jgi:Zn finger protein HypA/HybF involved in hydrogenase expression
MGKQRKLILACGLLTVAAIIFTYEFVWSGTRGISPDDAVVEQLSEEEARVRCHACNRSWGMTMGEYVAALRERSSHKADGIRCPHCNETQVWREERWVDQSDKFGR